MKNLTLKQIAAAVNGTLYHGETCDDCKEIAGAVIDSRKVEKDYLFIAVKGERADGHDFANDIFDKGAMAMIAEREMDIEKPYILVKSTLQALKDLAAFYREQITAKVIGISGSVGKTSTKEMIAAALSPKYQVLKTEGNFNNEIGVPLTLLRIRDYHEVAVIEMGISDFEEMHRLSYMVKPDICVLTNIGLCHLEHLGSRDGVLKAKTEMFDYAAEDCLVVLNGDDDKLAGIDEVHGKKPIFYSMEHPADLMAEEVRTRGIRGMSCSVIYTDYQTGTQRKLPLNIPVGGKHNVYNAMAAIAVGNLLGVSPQEMEQGIASLQSVGGRLHMIETGSYTIIDDCYNANPVSVKASLDVLDSADTRKVAILGDMFELGTEEKELHRMVGDYFKEKHIDAAILVGTLSENTYLAIKDSGASTETYYYETLEDVLDYLDIMIKQGDTILVKASHSMHFEKIVEKLKS